MNFNPHDPKWTAYLLGELDEPARQALEAEMAAWPPAQTLLDQLRDTSHVLAAVLQAEPAAGLDQARKAALAAEPAVSCSAHAGVSQGQAMSKRRWLNPRLALAASLLLAIGGAGALFLPKVKAAREVARRSASQNNLKQLAGGVMQGPGSAAPSPWYQTDDIQYHQPGPEFKQQREKTNAAKSDVYYETRSKDICFTVSKPVYETQQKDVGYTVAPPIGAGALYNRIAGPYNPLQTSLAPPDAAQVDSDGYVRLDQFGLSAALAPNAAEAYDDVTDNRFLSASDSPLSTFSIDVDTGSYSIVRRFLKQNQKLPPRSAIRIEELLNYFRYDYPQPTGDAPFSANIEVAQCPWATEHRLVRIGLKGREVARESRPPSNLVFLVDVSGSMQDANKLPLVKESLRLLTQQLGENDRVALVVYAGSSGLVLPSTIGTDKQKILQALDSLEAGGSTNGGQGIQLAYDTAMSHLVKGGTNRVILATDGDFNVGVTDRGELVKLIEQRAAGGVFLTTLGFGMGNLKDNTLEQLADKGNGNYAYIDTQAEAKKVLVEQLSGTLVTIAKDVKIQVEFNPTQVASYRLIGYENRALKNEDFNDDKKDAGEIGAGHTVTALYEVVLAGHDKDQPSATQAHAGPVNASETAPVAGTAATGASAETAPAVDPLKYQKRIVATEAAASGELLTLKLRYKQPDGDKSTLLEFSAKDPGQAYARASRDFKFAASVALFGMLLRDSPYKGTGTFDAAIELAQEGRGSDLEGYRAELIELVQLAKGFKGQASAYVPTQHGYGAPAYQPATPSEKVER